MVTRVAINGFGRIGRLVLRAIHDSKRKDLKIVAINDLGPVDEVNAQIWNSIWAQVTLKEMPPKDAEQPEVIARLKFSAWIVG